MKVDILRSVEQIRRAHDLLNEVGSGAATDIITVSPDDLKIVNVIKNTLCWVLSHKGGDVVGRKLRELDMAFLAAGYIQVEE